MNAKNRTFALGAVLVMCLTALACVNVVSDDSDAWNANAGTYIYMDSDYYDFEGEDCDISERCTTGTIWGSSASLNPTDHPGPPSTEYYLPQWASGTVSYNLIVMDGGGVDIIVDQTDSATVVGTYGLSSDRPITDTVDTGVWINGHYGTKTIYVRSGTQFDLRISDGYSTHNVNLSNNSCGLSVTSTDLGGRITGTLTGNVTISCSGVWATGDQSSATYNIVAVAAPVSYTHTIVYDANGGNGTVSNTVVTDQNNGNTNVTLAANGFSKAGYAFVGWKIGNTVYQPGQTVSVGANASVTATAQWSENTVTATANNISGVSGMSYTNQVGASASNGGSLSYAVKSCTGGTASVNANGLVTYNAPNVSSTTSFTVTITVTGTFSGGSTVVRDVSFTVSVDPVLSFTNAATSGTLSVKGA
ncbi:Listeria-Bacteroides repeat domain (List_Bact_rpt) [Thermoplasmatales archaeon BRNA1]|nr:Listeria-Bacteroides repeat domain (List_Bact_rpt) [Thermoplasmatales archaeon BRNA1]